ncbi:MAG: hypothetical protein LBD18_06495 [Treponema sp.]|jgi:chromosome segregation ATPase|nr:hypothetical protein [Treponema sp.]
MDERKKQIDDLEKQKRENLASLDALFLRLGEALLGRLGALAPEEATAFCGEIEEYRRLRQEIADSESAILSVEEQIRRFRELEEKIEAVEQENSACARELSGLYGRLGKCLLDAPPDSGYGLFAASWREQANTLCIKACSLEDRLAELEQKEENNVFAWIGKNAQALVLRSFLTKAEDNLEQIRRNIGERYSRQATIGENIEIEASSPADEAAGLAATIQQLKARSRALAGKLAELREERRKISGSFNAEGGALKQIQVLKSTIGQTQERLKLMYRRLGAEAACAIPAGLAGGGEASSQDRKQCIDSLATPDDRTSLESAARLNKSIKDDEEAIAKLQASLAIDRERAKMEKFRRQIDEKKARIADAEKDIAALAEHIRACEGYIEELQKQLQD